jgi:hypothetical protein
MTERICLVCGEVLTCIEANDPSNEGVCDACQAEIAFAGAARVRTQRACELLSVGHRFSSPFLSQGEC